MKMKICKNCGAVVTVERDCHCSCGFICCGDKMSDVVANSTDGAKEKHLPSYEKIGDEIKVKVNHVMDDDHYIEWVLMATDTETIKHTFKVGETPEVIFPYVKGSTLYAYCNKHGLWQTKVE